jgi:hypothetical protein
LTIPSENDVYFEVHEMPLPSRETSQESKRQRGLGRGFEWDLGIIKHHNRYTESTTISEELGTTITDSKNDLESYTSTINDVDTTQIMTTEKSIEFEISENEAHSICLNSLLNSSLGRACAEILKSEDLLLTIQMCVDGKFLII